MYDPAVTDDGFADRLHRDAPTASLVALLPTGETERLADELEAGAIDAITPDAGTRELVARLLGAVARMSSVTSQQVELAGLVVDLDAATVTWNGVPVELTGRERAILHALVATAGQSLTRERLYRIVWGYTMAHGDRIVDVNIKRLRGKLGAATDGEVEIVTRSRVGYGIGLRADAVTDASDGEQPEQAVPTTAGPRRVITRTTTRTCSRARSTTSSTT